LFLGRPSRGAATGRGVAEGRRRKSAGEKKGFMNIRSCFWYAGNQKKKAKRDGRGCRAETGPPALSERF